MTMLNPYKWVLILAMVIGSFFAGYHVKSKFDAAATAKYYEQMNKAIKENDDKSRNVIETLQNNLNTTTNAYNLLTEESKHVKIYTSKCDITPDGIKLWNDSTEGHISVVPKDSARTTETTSTSSTSPITVDDLLANKLQNDEICNGLRDQLEAIIKWDKDIWHDIDSAGN
jgi:hypothetical protein